MKTCSCKKIRILVLYILLIGCVDTGNPSIIQTETSSESLPIIESPQTDECLSSSPNLAIPVGKTIPPPSSEETPPKNWKVITEITDGADGFASDFVVHNGNIWISWYPSKVARYNLSDNSWTSYQLNEDASSIMLLSTQTNGVWAYIAGKQSGDNEKQIPLLYQYDDKKDEFFSVSDVNEVLYSPSEIRSEIKEDTNGILWMLISPRGNGISLYSFNPKSFQLEEHPIEVDETSAALLTLGRDGSIWTIDTIKKLLFRYDPKGNTIDSFDKIPGSGEEGNPGYSISDELLLTSFLYIDDNNRLWLGNTGWVDFANPEHLLFYKIIPSPVFLSYSYSQPIQYDYSYYVSSIHEDAKGQIWFSERNIGVVKLIIDNNEQQGSWCLITNGYSKVREDDDGGLWMIVFNKIFKYNLFP